MRVRAKIHPNDDGRAWRNVTSRHHHRSRPTEPVGEAALQVLRRAEFETSSVCRRRSLEHTENDFFLFAGSDDANREASGATEQKRTDPDAPGRRRHTGLKVDTPLVGLGSGERQFLGGLSLHTRD